MAIDKRPRVGRGAIALIVLVILAAAFGPRRSGAVVAAASVAGEALPLAAESAPASAGVEALLPSNDVRVRVVDAGGAPLARVALVVDVIGARGESLLEAFGASDAEGHALFVGLAGLAREFEAGSRLELRFEQARPGKLVFRARSLPEREWILVRIEAPKDPLEADTEPVAPSVPELELAADATPPVAELTTALGSVEPSTPALVSEPVALFAEFASATSGSIGVPVGPVDSAALVEPVELPLALETEQQVSTSRVQPGSLAGRLQLDPGVPAFELRVELDEVLPGQPGRQGRRLGPLSPDADGRFHFDGIAPGLCALRVSLWGSPRALAWVDDLEVLPGEELRDARLEPFDLTGRFLPVDVELFDEVGRRLALGTAAPIDKQTGARGSLRVQDAGARPRIWCDRRAQLGEGGLDLALEAPGFAPRQVHVLPEQLAAGKPLRFALEVERAKPLELRLVAPPPAGSQLEVRLLRPDGAERPWDFARHRGRLDARGRVRLEPAETGAFEVHVFDVATGAPVDLGLRVPVVVHAREPESVPVEVEVLFLPLVLDALE